MTPGAATGDDAVAGLGELLGEQDGGLIEFVFRVGAGAAED
jgi:hypothetical protein